MQLSGLGYPDSSETEAPPSELLLEKGMPPVGGEMVSDVIWECTEARRRSDGWGRTGRGKSLQFGGLPMKAAARGTGRLGPLPSAQAEMVSRSDSLHGDRAPRDNRRFGRSTPNLMTTANLKVGELLKFALLAEGIAIATSASEYVASFNGDRPLTPADYASTSGVILELEGDIWVNAPFAAHNPNFVTEQSNYELVYDGGLVVRGDGREVGAKFWLPPAYHGTSNALGEPYNSYAFTHADRVRISPIEGCSMTCKFCNLPYEFRYRTKRVESLVDSVQRAISDELQPAMHVLISGGTPKSADVGYVRDVYQQVLGTFPEVPIDIMMVPRDKLLDPEWLADLGIGELSVNLEIFSAERGRLLMRQKAAQGVESYLQYFEDAATHLGEHRVRSMLMVGLEPMEYTLAGVRAIAERGAVPVLSPFRPDPATPLRDLSPPSADFMIETYLRAREITAELGSPLGPSCIPCSHNTLTLSAKGTGDAHRFHGHPNTI